MSDSKSLIAEGVLPLRIPGYAVNSVDPLRIEFLTIHPKRGPLDPNGCKISEVIALANSILGTIDHYRLNNSGINILLAPCQPHHQQIKIITGILSPQSKASCLSYAYWYATASCAHYRVLSKKANKSAITCIKHESSGKYSLYETNAIGDNNSLGVVTFDTSGHPDLTGLVLHKEHWNTKLVGATDNAGVNRRAQVEATIRKRYNFAREFTTPACATRAIEALFENTRITRSLAGSSQHHTFSVDPGLADLLNSLTTLCNRRFSRGFIASYKSAMSMEQIMQIVAEKVKNVAGGDVLEENNNIRCWIEGGMPLEGEEQSPMIHAQHQLNRINEALKELEDLSKPLVDNRDRLVNLMDTVKEMCQQATLGQLFV